MTNVIGKGVGDVGHTYPPLPEEVEAVRRLLARRKEPDFLLAMLFGDDLEKSSGPAG